MNNITEAQLLAIAQEIFSDLAEEGKGETELIYETPFGTISFTVPSASCPKKIHK